MESRIIILRRDLTANNLVFHMGRFFRRTPFTSDYISVQLQMIDKRDISNRFFLGDNVILCVNNKHEITRYIEYLIDRYYEFIDKNDINLISKLNIIFAPKSNKDYENYLRSESK